MIMLATVIRTEPGSLLVRDFETGNEVMVFFRNANRFSSGDRVRITYSGRMTLSIPPQITADSIERLPSPAPPSPPTPRPPAPRPPQQEVSEIRALVLQRGRDSLLVTNLRDGSILRVDYRNANRFNVGQLVLVRYDTITFSNPPRVTATEVIPIR